MEKQARINGNDSGLNLKLTDLLDLKHWQNVQDNLSMVTNVTLRTVDADCKPITATSSELMLCHQILRDSAQKDKICGSCMPTFLGGKWDVDKNLSYICEFGLYNFAAPLQTGEKEKKTWGYVLAGPVVLVKRRDKEDYLRLAEELNVDLEEVWSAILEIKVMSFHGVKSILNLIEDVAEYTMETMHRSIMSKREEVAMAIEPLKLNKILEALLEVAFEVSRADIGSIMFLDRAKGALTIQAAKGIDDDVVRNTRVRLGDGISGLAAKEGETFLIDENLDDNRIRPYLNRAQISSSMVLPFKVQNKIMGVMNLGALKSSAVRFDKNSINVINRLINLAAMAL